VPRSGQATRQRILDAAYEFFRRSGFTRVSMDEIAAATVVTKRTLYYHFESKDALLAEAELIRLLERAGIPRPRECAREIWLLSEGAISMILVHGDRRYAAAAGQAALKLVRFNRARA